MERAEQCAAAALVGSKTTAACPDSFAAADARSRRHGAVACGHTHHVEDVVIDGIHYFNTGSWTETPVFYLDVTDTDIELRTIPGAGHLAEGLKTAL